MKHLTILLLISTCMLLGNPIDSSPTVHEFQIIAPDNWFIEINYENGIDSIFIFNKSDSAKVLEFQVSEDVVVVTQDNLDKEIKFDKNNDCVGLKLYYGSEYYKKSVNIGTYQDSYLRNISSDQSIVYDMHSSSYSKSNEPKIGDIYNEFQKCTIYGHFYDGASKPIKDEKFVFYNIMWNPYLYTDSTGFYTATRDARYYYYDALRYNSTSPDAEVWEFYPIEFYLEPGDSIEVNFISKKVLTSIKPVIQSPIMLNNYPQPATDYSWFVIGNTDIEASALRMNVYDLTGRRVDSFIPSSHQVRYDCSHLAQGTYIMSLQKGNKQLASKKLQIMK